MKSALFIVCALCALRGVHATAAAAPEFKRSDDKPGEQTFMR